MTTYDDARSPLQTQKNMCKWNAQVLKDIYKCPAGHQDSNYWRTRRVYRQVLQSVMWLFRSFQSFNTTFSDILGTTSLQPLQKDCLDDFLFFVGCDIIKTGWKYESDISFPISHRGEWGTYSANLLERSEAKRLMIRAGTKAHHLLLFSNLSD